MRSKATLITLTITAVMFFFFGLTSLVDGITAMNANELDFNTMSQYEMEKYSHVTGELDYVYGCFAEGYTERTTYGITTSQTVDSYYYLIKCPYSPDDTVMILEVPANSFLETSVDDVWYSSYYPNVGNGTRTITVQFSGYLERNEEEVVGYAEEALEESEYHGLTIAPYTVNCTIADGLASRCLTMAAVLLSLVAIFVIVVIFMFKRSSRVYSYSSSYNTSRSNLGIEVGNEFIPASNSRVENYYGGTYRSNSDSTSGNGTQTTYQSQYRSQPTPSSQTYQSQYQSQPTQSSQTYQSQYQSQPTQSSQTYQSQYRSQPTQSSQTYQPQYQSQYTNNSYGSGYYNNGTDSTNDINNDDNDNSYPHYY